MPNRVLVASTGKQSELITELPITTTAGRTPRVAMSLGPHGANQSARLPDLRRGDTLLVMADAEVTTDTAAQGVTNVGTPYTYNPTLTARLLLAASSNETGATRGRAIEITAAKQETVTQVRHHHVVTFDRFQFTIPAQGLPWAAADTCLNLVLAASSPRARRRNVLIVGENEPDGSVRGDKGRISVIRLRPGSQPLLRATPSQSPLATGIPVDKDARTVVFSQQLGNLRRGEQLAARFELRTSSARLPYPARISTRVFLADSRAQAETGGLAQKLASTGGELCENSGFNTTKATSPGISRRNGVVRIEADATGYHYLNLVAVSGDAGTGRARPGDQLRVLSGFLERIRFPAQMRG